MYRLRKHESPSRVFSGWLVHLFFLNQYNTGSGTSFSLSPTKTCSPHFCTDRSERKKRKRVERNIFIWIDCDCAGDDNSPDCRDECDFRCAWQQLARASASRFDRRTGRQDRQNQRAKEKRKKREEQEEGKRRRQQEQGKGRRQQEQGKLNKKEGKQKQKQKEEEASRRRAKRGREKQKESTDNRWCRA